VAIAVRLGQSERGTLQCNLSFGFVAKLLSVLNVAALRLLATDQWSAPCQAVQCWASCWLRHMSVCTSQAGRQPYY